MYKPVEETMVIGFGHRARQGKDVSASRIVSRVGGGCERFPFAEDLYSVARTMFGMTTKDPALLQVLGTEVFRKKDPEIWIRNVYHKILDRKPQVALITDVRFPNEAEFIKQMGGTLVKVNRWENGKLYQDPSRNPNHPSESSLNDYLDWDFILEAQSGDLDKLHQEVDYMLDILRLT